MVVGPGWTWCMHARATSARFNYRNGLCVLQPGCRAPRVINARKSVLADYEAEVRYTPGHGYRKNVIIGRKTIA